MAYNSYIFLGNSQLVSQKSHVILKQNENWLKPSYFWNDCLACASKTKKLFHLNERLAAPGGLHCSQHVSNTYTVYNEANE